MMKLSAYFVTTVTLSTTISISSSFQIEPDRAKIFKNAIETSVDHPILKQLDTEGSSKDERPMITLFDDDSYSPLTPALGTFVSSVSHVFRAKQSVILDDSKYHRPRPLYESVDFGLNQRRDVLPTKRAVPRKQFGCDDNPSEYWFNNRIHSFGNTGFLGAFHAAVAPLATTMIDVLAYEKRDVRAKVSKLLRDKVIKKTEARVLDLCCGVGISTRALKSAFHDADTVIGIDTSPEMIATARAWTRHEIAIKFLNVMLNQTMELAKDFHNNIDINFLDETNLLSEITNAMFARGNAERTIFPDRSFDLVTIMYGFHEIPKVGRYRILREVRRLLSEGGTLALIDICPEYEPSKSMLMGEPYVLEYQRNIHTQMKHIQGFTDLKYKVLIPGHVGMWLLTRKSSTTSSPAYAEKAILSKKLPY